MSQQPPDRPTEPPEGWGPPGGQQPPPEGTPGAQGQGWGQPPGQQGPYGPPPGQQPGWGPSTDDPTETTARTRTTEASVEQAAGIGDAVRDGKFEFVVSKVTCGRNRIGDTNFGKDAQGQFCMVNVKVKNIGKEAQTLDASSQYLYGSGGQRFDADTEAAVYLGLNETRTFLEDINPGNAVNGVLIYDTPKGQKPTKIELHDSPFSGGVTVEL